MKPPKEIRDTDLSDAAVAHQLTQYFIKSYGHKPSVSVSAPGRVNLIGEHVDYNGGIVVPMAIDRRTWMAASETDEPRIALKSTFVEGEILVALDGPLQPSGGWQDYVLGVLECIRRLGYPLRGFRACIHSTVPAGSGLSSSAALEVATATMAEVLGGFTLTAWDKAGICRDAEHEFAGVPCGLMDQLVSSAARRDHVIRFDCLKDVYSHVAFDHPETSVLIINSHVSHALKEGAYAKRRAACEQAAGILGIPSLGLLSLEGLARDRSRLPEEIRPMVNHVVAEIHRTALFTDCLYKKEWVEAGQLMYQSHESLRSDYQVSCKEIDFLVDAARRIGTRGGLYGCRITGGGFGGCAVALVHSDQSQSISSKLAELYEDQFGIKPDFYLSKPSEGARVDRMA